MEYIGAEEFLKQDIDTQIIFMEWWIPKVGDLFHTNEYGMEVYLDKKEKGMFGTDGFYTSKKVIPLLTEGQLRKFIEDKTNKKFDIQLCFEETTNKNEYAFFESGYCSTSYYKLGTDLLQAYWKVALEIAKEKIKED